MELPSNLLADESSPEWMNKGDNAWQLTAATMVGLQSIPGLVILYGSLVKKTWAINSAFMAFYAFAAVLLCWVSWAFHMSFGDKMVFFLGKPGVALDEKFLLGKAFLGNFPNATMVFYQGVFAGITLILIAGALLGRMNIKAWMLFVPLWVTFSYSVTAFSIWCPDGWLAKRGVIDFAGGYVIHLSAGVAGFTAAYWVGPRSEKDREIFPEAANNMIMMLAGAGLLWMGWSGFNGGGPFMASTIASLAILNTHVCTAASIIVWVLLDTFYFGKPTVFGAVQGMITGLVCITPAAGVVQGWAAMLMGLISGSIPWYTMMVLHNKINFLNKIDDPMSVFHTHAVAGALGGILTGFFAVPKLCRLFYMVPNWENYVGLAYGLQNKGATRAGLKQMAVQIEAIVFVICFNVLMTSLICLVVGVMVPLRINNDVLLMGDKAIHGEDAFAMNSETAKFVNVKRNKIYDTQDFSSIHESRSLDELQMV
ncbi:ammonium transporter 2 member 4 [Cicer arietinum]|uniref:Ammonium transporter 3 member 3-like n=1 Tax=Cicer arietinum TaxID=3827 RepID=A0A1S2XUF7_CICAR|nr:ammonium transporter 3 member 3-like [Cicer arietinum]XP_027188283.1 ammonium transporter 3 member 3-like [Cicer arietinum]